MLEGLDQPWSWRGCCLDVYKPANVGIERKYVRSTSSSRSGRFSRFFWRLSVAFLRSNASCVACRELIANQCLSLKWVGRAYGAAVVLSRMLRFFKSCGSGRVCRCFSRESRRWTGEMGVSSTGTGFSFSAILKITWTKSLIVTIERCEVGGASTCYSVWKLEEYGVSWDNARTASWTRQTRIARQLN